MKYNLFALAALFLISPYTVYAHEHGHAETPAAEAKAEETNPATAQTTEQPAATQTEDVQITVQQIGETVHLLQGHGGNVALSVGKDGVFIIDSDYAEITPTLIKAVKTITDQPIKYLINTHWHGDHTGGNEFIGKQGTIILAHDNVRKHLSVDNYIPAFDMKMAAAPEIALPSLTFDNTMTVHMNDEDAQLVHIANAHTDSDIIVRFPKNNIIHTGDIYFNGFYPFIDAASGGTLDGMIAASDVVLGLTDENTKIIPGHGPLSNKAQLQAYRDMLAAVRDKLKPLVDSGKTLEEIAATKPLDEFNSVWGNGFIPGDKWLGIVLDAMKPAVSAEKIDTGK